MHICTNCGFEYEGKFCPECGIKKNDGRIYFKDQLHDALYYVFSLSSPLTTTFKELLINPGRVGHEYIQGKRKKYYTPIKYFILCTAIYFILIKITGIDPASKGTSEVIRKNSSYFIFVLVPIFALFSKLFFYKQRYHYAEYLAYSFFVCGHFMLLNSLAIPLIYLFPGIQIGNNLFFGYLIWALVSFHKGNLLMRITYSFLVTITSLVLYLLTVVYSIYLFLLITH